MQLETNSNSFPVVCKNSNFVHLPDFSGVSRRTVCTTNLCAVFIQRVCLCRQVLFLKPNLTISHANCLLLIVNICKFGSNNNRWMCNSSFNWALPGSQSSVVSLPSFGICLNFLLGLLRLQSLAKKQINIVQGTINWLDEWFCNFMTCRTNVATVIGLMNCINLFGCRQSFSRSPYFMAAAQIDFNKPSGNETRRRSNPFSVWSSIWNADLSFFLLHINLNVYFFLWLP